jgi:predicted N-acetyltransferase YhbS
MLEKSKPELAAATVRNLRPSDLEAVVAIDRAAMGRARKLFFEKRLETVQADPDRYITLGAEADGQLVGYAIAHLGKGEFGADFSTAVLEAIGVTPDGQRAGIGAALIQAMENTARKKDIAGLYSQVDFSNSKLLAFFARSGLSLAPRTLLERDISDGLDTSFGGGLNAPEQSYGPTEPTELDFSDSLGDDFESLARDHIPIRSMRADDLDEIVEIDRRITGRTRRPYYERLMAQVMGKTGVRVSLVAEIEDFVIGFVMARVDYGEFGSSEPVAVLDTIGIRPDYQHEDIGAALVSQLTVNLVALRIERIRTVVPWDEFEFLRFLAVNGFYPAQRLCLWKPLT